MIKRRSVSANALANVLQAVVGALLIFLLYRYINTTLGVDQLGVWSVILATVSASRLADFGLSAGVTRFVARDRVRKELLRAAQVVDTAALALMVLVGAIAPLLYPLIMKLLPHLFVAEHLELAKQILPYALTSFWLTIVAAIFQSALDGCQRMDLRAVLIISGQLLLLFIAFLLVPKYGLVGLAWAQIGQGIYLLILGRLMLRFIMPDVSFIPFRWKKNVLREMVGYGVNVQAATIFILLLDPVAKALMARFGGAASAGYFEMASQVVLKARSVIVAANQAVVPRIAELAESEMDRIRDFYRSNMRVVIFVTFPLLALLVSWAGVLSWLLMGFYHREFIFLVSVLAFSWGVNIFSGPAYFTNMGIGKVGWNTVSSMIIGLMNLGLGVFLGSCYGASGVVAAYTISLVTGSMFLISLFHRKARISFGGINSDDLKLVVICTSMIAIGLLLWSRVDSISFAEEFVWILMSTMILVLTSWHHPMRAHLLNSPLRA